MGTKRLLKKRIMAGAECGLFAVNSIVFLQGISRLFFNQRFLGSTQRKSTCHMFTHVSSFLQLFSPLFMFVFMFVCFLVSPPRFQNNECTPYTETESVGKVLG